MKSIVRYNNHILAAFIILLLEVVVFNFGFFKTAGYDERILSISENSPVLSEMDLGQEAEPIIEAEFPPERIDNVFIDVREISGGKWLPEEELKKSAMYVTISVKDEGHEDYYTLGTRQLCPYVKNSMIMDIEPFGRVSALKLTFPNNKNKSCSIDSVRVNCRRPFNFKLSRVVIFMLIYLLLYYLFGMESSTLYVGEIANRKLVVFVLVAVLTMLLISLQFQVLEKDYNQYGKMAESLLGGRVYLEMPVSHPLAEMANPYDRGARDAGDVAYLWDTAFFQGKYYSYFGIVPVLLFFVPFYLLMNGEYLSYGLCQVVILIFMLWGINRLFDRLIKKYAPGMLYKTGMVINTTAMLCTGSLMMVKRTAIYYVAIGCAIMFTAWGLYFWIKSQDAKKASIIYGMLGSLFMALAVGCRPQFALGSFLFFFVCEKQLEEIKNIFKIRKAGNNSAVVLSGRSVVIKSIFSLLLMLFPYVPVAALMMWYNKARFGSVTDFGASYNLTEYDVLHTGFHAKRVVMGLWYYLLQLPSFIPEFPYLRAVNIQTQYMGHIFSEKITGGAIAALPILWFVVYGIFSLKRLKAIRTLKGYLFCLFITVVIVISNAVMGGIAMRYQMDFLLFLMIAALMVIAVFFQGNENSFMLFDGIEVSSKRMSAITNLLCLLTILFCALMLMAQYETPDYSETVNQLTGYADTNNPVLYQKVRDMFGLFY